RHVPLRHRPRKNRPAPNLLFEKEAVCRSLFPIAPGIFLLPTVTAADSINKERPAERKQRKRATPSQVQPPFRCRFTASPPYCHVVEREISRCVHSVIARIGAGNVELHLCHRTQRRQIKTYPIRQIKIGRASCRERV